MFQDSVKHRWLPTPVASFPFTSPPVRRRVPSRFNWTILHTIEEQVTIFNFVFRLSFLLLHQKDLAHNPMWLLQAHDWKCQAYIINNSRSKAAVRNQRQ